MKLQLASDLHLEFIQRRFPGNRVITPAPDADALLLTGDIHYHAQALEAFADWPVPVLYVLGNHEFYGANFDELLTVAREKATGTQVRLLEMDELVLNGVRFLGATLWTDYEITGIPARAMRAAEMYLADHRHIRTASGVFTPSDALARHRLSRAWLEERLNTKFDGKTVVMSHHGPHPQSIHKRFEGDSLNGAFNSDLTSLLALADVWVHGHVHDTFSYKVGSCKVFANPRGYAFNLHSTPTFEELRWENPDFQPHLIIEV